MSFAFGPPIFREVDPSEHAALFRRDADDVVGLLDVCPDLAADISSSFSRSMRTPASITFSFRRS